MDTPVMWLKSIVPDLPFPEYDTDDAGKDILEYEGLDKAVDEFADRITLSGSHVLGSSSVITLTCAGNNTTSSLSKTPSSAPPT